MSVQQADQPPLVYPVSETNPPSHRPSDGSFGEVFIVLAVIVVVSAVACFLGRLCNKRYNKSKPSKRGRHTKGKDTKPNHNVFHTKDGDIEFGFDKRFSSAKVAANGEPNIGPNMGRHDSFGEPNMGPHLGRPNSFGEPNMGPHMGRPNSFGEPNMGSSLGRHNSFRGPNMGPNLGRPNSLKEPPMGRSDSFHEPSTGRPNSFRRGEFRDDHMRFGGNEDHEMKFNSGTGPQYY
ncbi:hypothetical protein L1987_11338 [Smallanthus sonchifolius]|uniref:Uncharacterized protein n=1 Tax=Smallanthus sonchifolius TaxID=185202 RepID=A0ACB9JC78_9ASTR|nr:hypothetical protein L1987_11338 [Smallanthus sonchifolius]